MPGSIFTKIINREIPAKIEYEDDEIIAFNDIDPKAPVHILIVPKKEIETINAADEEDVALLGRIILTAKKLAKDKGIDKTGYRLVLNCGEGAGQSVFHIHCHLLGGRKFNWPPG